MGFRLQGNKFVFDDDPSQQVYNTLGRSNADKNFFERKASSIGNAVGTTLSAPISIAHDIGENIATAELLGRTKSNMNDVYKQFGFQGRDDYDRQLDAAEAAGDDAEVQRLLNLPGLQSALQKQANANAAEANAKAAGYDDYRKNNLISQNINQDRGKFLGSAINTLSTAYDVASMATGIPNGPITNAVQGGVEGIADELEENGLENFDWGRAGQNAAIGAASGAATGAFNNALGSKNLLGKGLTNKLAKSGVGRATLGLANGTVRGAASGAVGGATGAGLSSIMNNADFGTGLQNTIQGAVRGAGSGAMVGGTMAGINMGTNAALNKYAPQMAQKVQDTSQEYQRWKDSGKDFNERLTNTLTSGRSAVGEWLQGNRQSKVLGAAGNIGNRVQDVSGQPQFDKEGLTKMIRDARKNGLTFRDVLALAEAYGIEADGRVNADELLDFVGEQNKANPQEQLRNNTRSLNIGDRQSIVDYLEADAEGIPQTAPAYRAGGAFDEAVTDLRNNYTDTELAEMLRNTNNSKIRSVIQGALKIPNTPTTAAGWLKKAGQRIVEDVNNKGVGLSIKDVSETDRPDGNWRSGKVGDYEYEAKYYNTDPDEIDQRGGYNIKGSPLSKLFIKDKNGEYVANYDRGWGDGKPTDPRVLQAVDDVNNYYRNEWESIRRSGLPNDVDADDIRTLMQADNSNRLRGAIMEATEGRDVSLQDVADKYWDEVRYRYESKVANDAAQTNNRGAGLSIKNVGDESYGEALNRGMNEGLSGPELGDRLAQYSNLPDKMNGNNLGTKSNYSSQEIMDAGVKALGLGDKYTGSSKQSQVQRIMEAGFDALNLESPYDSRISGRVKPDFGTEDFSRLENSYYKMVDKLNGGDDWQAFDNYLYDKGADDLRYAVQGLQSQYSALLHGEVRPEYRGEYLDEIAKAIPEVKALAEQTGDANIINRTKVLTDFVENNPLGETTTQASSTQPQSPTTAKGWQSLVDDYDEEIYDLQSELDTAIAEGDADYQRVLQAKIGDAVNQRAWAMQNRDNVGRNSTPTTAAGWLKKAGKRAVEDINNSNLGLRVKDVSNETQTPVMREGEDIAARVESPETEVYRQLTGEKSKALTEAEAKQRIRDIKADELENTAAKELLSQFGTVPKKVANVDNMVENAKMLKKLGLTKPEEWRLASDAITGQNGVMSRLHRNLISEAGDIDTYAGNGGRYGKSIDETIDYIIKSHGLVDSDAKGVKNEITAIMDALPSRLNGSINMTDSAEDVMKMIRKLEAHKRDYRGENTDNYGRSNETRDQKAAAISDVARVFEDRIYEKIQDVSKVVTPEAKAELKSYFPGNEEWAKYIDNTFAKIKTGKDLRGAQVPYVQVSDYIEQVKKNFGTYGQRVGDAYSNALSQGLKKVPVVGSVLAQATDTPFMQRRYAGVNMFRANRLRNKATKNSATPNTTNAGNENPTPAGGSTVPPTQIAETAGASQAYNPATQIYNAIGRNEGLSNGERARTAQYLNDVAQEAEVVPSADTVSTTAGNNQSTAVYNALTGVTTTNGAPMSLEEERQTYFFRPVGDEWADMLSRALRRASNAEDYEAMDELMAMYREAVSDAQSNSTSSTADLSATQQAQLAKLDAADSAIDELEGLFENAGGGKGPIAGGLQSIAGDWGLDTNARTYNQLSEGLVNQIAQAVGKTDSLNTEGEVKRALQLIPQLTDDAQTARNKLEALRRMLATTKSSYNAAYGITA